ncbi:DUF4389 domain-containing protein [Phycicoccus sp. SLBN-51]|jgi:hypothetical protein|uniref:DUF4389 domain-containing protein n=1 Tax=Phycicoccus sp. SLBN-51 TaxID=2768447 RepID=UPI00116F6FC1|nr:DUF4389 domain-containing protein [Phycicoccus sp. SLBN-51]TQJ48543.1 uncharacterized protein DUF4389 [Phycicoccus sp. SLBN-51]
MTTATIPPRPSYPVHVDSSTEPVASRWLWLVKWLLAVPHYIVLAFLWIAFTILSIVAFFAILFTGSYPRAIFDFNVGVMRWSWRVAYYAYGALATDRYPPFTLAEVPDYPTHLQIDYPHHLSRGLVLVKWWLLAIPHYLVLAIIVGGGRWAFEDNRWRYVDSAGLVGLLAFIAAVVLLFTGSYPRPIYDLLLGLNRWVLRVAAYVALMTDQYPPFRLDMGPHEPHALVVSSQAGGPPSAPNPAMMSSSPGQAPPPTQGPSQQGPPQQVQGPPQQPYAAGSPYAGAEPYPGTYYGGPGAPGAPGGPPPARSGWTGGRIVSVVVGVLVGLMSLGGLAAGGAMVVADRAFRENGFVMTPTETWRSGGYAVVGNVLLESARDRTLPGRLIGDVRIEATSTRTDVPVFVGVARASDARAYLSGVAHVFRNNGTRNGQEITGGAPPAAPTSLDIWVSQANGAGTQAAVWSPEDGSWSAVVMNADGSPGVSASMRFGAEVPWLGGVGVGLFLVSLVVLGGSVTLVAVAVARASRRTTA